jgi:hypothetical protein
MDDSKRTMNAQLGINDGLITLLDATPVHNRRVSGS